MRYALIGTDGELTVHDGAWSDIEALFPEGWAGVAMPQVDCSYGFRGVISDVGHTLPDRYPRNISASLLLFSFHQEPQPIPGPLVVTGFVTPHHDAPDYVSLNDHQEAVLRWIYADVRAGLRGEAAPNPAEWAPGEWDQYLAEIRATAAYVNAMPTPTLQTSGDARRPR